MEAWFCCRTFFWSGLQTDSLLGNLVNRLKSDAQIIYLLQPKFRGPPLRGSRYQMQKHIHHLIREILTCTTDDENLRQNLRPLMPRNFTYMTYLWFSVVFILPFSGMHIYLNKIFSVYTTFCLPGPISSISFMLWACLMSCRVEKQVPSGLNYRR